MTAMTLKADLLNETWEDVEKLFYSTVHRHIKKYGGVFEDYLGQIHLSFMTAVLTYTPDRKASFSTYCVFVLSHDLLELRRKASKHAGKVAFVELEPNCHIAPRPFDLFGFLDGLSEDARLMVKIALDTPQELNDIMIQKGGTGHARKKALKNYLLDCGWNATHIVECFEEIAQALCS